MDDLDFIILKKLLENSRLTYREIGDILNMSVSAIHKRINKLVDDGIIDGFIARPSIQALKYIWVLITGPSNTRLIDPIIKELGNHENVKAIAMAGGKFLYVSAFLRNLSELQEFSSYVSEKARISEPTVGIINIPYITTPEILTSIDYQILRSLNKNSRKSITEITDDTGLSAKTVRKRLDRMVENHLADFIIELRLMAKDCFVTIFRIHLNEGTNIASTLEYLDKKYSNNFAHLLSYSNIPNLITMHSWAKTPDESHKLHNDLLNEGFKDIIPHIFLDVNYYDCWLDQLVRTK